MRRTGIIVLLAAGLAWFPAASLDADVKTQEKGHVKFEGALGRIVNMFGGKAAREGVVSNVSVIGDRKATMHDDGGQIIDLAEEKIYDIDTRRKTYKVTTFEELRQQMREAQERAAKDARDEEKAEPGEPGREMEIDFDVKETGERKEIAGHNTRQVIVTITAREKGKTLEEGGGLVLTSDAWMAEALPAMKEIQDFNLRYAQKLDLAGAAGTSAQQMATAMAMFPGLQKAMERMQAEGTKLDGTPLESTLLVESVKSAEQMAQAQQEDSGGGGMGGLLARKMMRKKQEPQSARGTIMTINHQVLSIATSVSPAELEIPAGFKLRS